MLSLLFKRMCKSCERRLIFIVAAQSFLEFDFRVVKNAFSVVDISHRSVHFHIVRIKLQSLLDCVLGFFYFVVFQKKIRVLLDCVKPARFCAQCRFVMRESLFCVADFSVAPRNVKMKNRMVRIKLESALVSLNRFLLVALKRVDCPQVIVGKDIFRIFSDYVFKAAERVIIVAHLPVSESNIVVDCRQVLWRIVRDKQSLLQNCDRLVKTLFSAVDSSKSHKDCEIFRIRL